MSRSYFFRQLAEGCCYTLIVVISSCVKGYRWSDHLDFALLVGLSMLLYPMSKFMIHSLASRIFEPATWRKIFGLHITNVSGIPVIFALICLIFAVPLGGGYCIFLCIKRA
jgi:ABC-type amino acid transport system permease subunit